MPIEVDGVTLAGKQLEYYERFLEEHRNGRKIHWRVLGLAGTGKTTLLKAIKNRPRNEFGSPKCLATAFVKNAARMIGAKTINQTFLLPRNGEPDNAHEVAIDRMNEELRSVDVLLIDNINFVDDNIFVSINRRLQEAFGNGEPFGGISVICFGDFYQQKRPDTRSIYGDGSQSVGLWRLFELFELTENYKFKTEEEKIVLNVIATISEETVVQTEEMSTLMEETKEYLGRHCRIEGGQEEHKQFTVIAPSNGMVKDVQWVDSAYNYLDSQGLSFDGVIIVRELFWGGGPHQLGEGQFYSAISRAKSLKNCRITPMDPLKWTVPAGANKEMRRLRIHKYIRRLKTANNQVVNP